MVGHETNAGALNYTLWELARNPHAQAKLREEVMAIQGHPTYEDLQTKFPYLDAVCKEGSGNHSYPSCDCF